MSASCVRLSPPQSRRTTSESCNGVIDAKALPNIDAEFPHTIPAIPVIAEVAQLNPIDSPVNGDFRLRIANSSTPFHKEVFLILRQVMANLVHSSTFLFSFINEQKSRRKTLLNYFHSRQRATPPKIPDSLETIFTSGPGSKVIFLVLPPPM